MSNSSCGFRLNCSILAIIASLIIGIVTAFLTITAAIVITPAFLWVVLGVAAVYLGILVLTRNSDRRRCTCSALPTLIAGILGAILTSIILLGITFAATSVIGAIIAGLLLAFLSLIFTSAACLVLCESGCDE